MIPRIIHQLHIDLGNGVSPNWNKTYTDSQESIRKFCPSFQYKLWDEKDVLALPISAEWRKFYHAVRYDINRWDLGRMLIAQYIGGVFCDMDVIFTEESEDALNKVIEEDIEGFAPSEKDPDTPAWYRYDTRHKKENKNSFYGQDRLDKAGVEILITKPNSWISNKYFELVRENYKQKCDIKVYKTWTGRFVNQTTGPMFIRRILPDPQPVLKSLYKKFIYKRAQGWAVENVKGSRLKICDTSDPSIAKLHPSHNT